MTETVPMFEDLPIYQEDLDKIKAKKPKVNALQEVVLEIMNVLGLKDADIIKNTPIPWPTWHGWVTGDVRCQLVDDNLLHLFRFLKSLAPRLTLEYLCFGTGPGPFDEDETDKTA